MILKKFLLASLFIFILAGCGAGILERPSYKPINFQNYTSVELWKNSNQYQMVTIKQNYGKLEISFGNNGTFLPGTKFLEKSSPGYGLSMVLEIINNGNSPAVIDLFNSNIIDKNGRIWKILNCVEKIVDNAQVSTTKIVARDEVNPYATRTHTSSYVKDYSDGSFVKCNSDSQKYLFIYLASDYQNKNELPESLTFSIQSKNGTTKTTSKFKFDKISW